MAYREEIVKKCKEIQLIAFDVDGVLTDATVYYSKEGEELKRFYLRDGMGIELAMQEGIEIAFITRENTPIVKRRAEKLQLKHLFMGVMDKLPVLQKLTEDLELSADEVAYMGDDVIDLEALNYAGLSAAPSDAEEVVKDKVDYISVSKGGHGAARDLINLILTLKNF